ncbi:hypothetical protein [Aliiroseovarius sp. 2305UL8-7]|uniref:hypothetical protein n=1 Tax=Aliiroseovarius conchicola TaxID=3121637 RepID=UPI0035271551
MAIEGEEEFLRWLDHQPDRLRVVIASRAAIRVFPLVTTQELIPPSIEFYFEPYALKCARAILVSFVASKFPKSSEMREVLRLASFAIEKISLGLELSASTAGSSYAAAKAAVQAMQTEDSASDACLSAAFAALVIAQNSDSDASFRAVAQEDAQIELANLRESPIWHQPFEPDWIAVAAPTHNRLLNRNHTWSFWRDWYQGFLDGKPLDWELQRRVALIPDEDWEKGPEHMAEKIRQIREQFDLGRAAKQERHKELEPSSVDHLLSAPAISASQIKAAAHDIREATCRYLNDTGANDLPDAFQSLPAISQSLLMVSGKVRESSLSPSLEKELRQEIGRLNAHVLELETQIANLQATGDPAFRKALKAQAGKSLGDWKMYAAMLGAVWMISGDTVGMKSRLENLNAAREAIFGTVEAPVVEPIDAQPPTSDI